MKDLTAFLDPDLPLKLGVHTYTVRPPTLAVGLQLAAINAAGVAGYLATLGQCPSCGRAGNLDITPETQAVLDAVADTPLGVLSLGQDVYDQMIADAIPGKHVDQAALYALYYWVLGRDTADKIIEATAEAAHGTGGAQAPKASKTGRSTASGSRTKTASTPTT